MIIFRDCWLPEQSPPGDTRQSPSGHDWNVSDLVVPKWCCDSLILNINLIPLFDSILKSFPVRKNILVLWWDFDAEKGHQKSKLFFGCWYWESLMDFFIQVVWTSQISDRERNAKDFSSGWIIFIVLKYFLILNYFQSVGAESDKGYPCPGICRLSQAEEDVSRKWWNIFISDYFSITFPLYWVLVFSPLYRRQERPYFSRYKGGQ